ncbi:MAG TPA: Crp/Fnr family transcriptional regulator [Sulfurovum sp.]|nr:Crp/Fnr family transcriptional regulator [Sulfurovum sp.]
MSPTQNIIHSLRFFSSLNEGQMEQLGSICSVANYKKEYVLHYEKSKTDRLLFLVEGLAKAYRMDKHDNETFLYHIYQDRMLSELSTFEDDQLVSYSNIMLIEDSKILSIDYPKFKRYFLDNGILCTELAKEVIIKSKQLQDLVDREIIFDSVSKVAMMLDTDISMFNRLKRYDVSAMLHIQPATLSRVLNRLKRDAIIDIFHGEVKILQREKLTKIYKGDRA